ncbi:hypothetical protein VTJ04DRAFT_2621 [Mycothermus thermophilus]|uniref:uncharacterized protein n=1 Tax=Humicola insolens TaxID=85995 RepID=UPI0037431601
MGRSWFQSRGPLFSLSCCMYMMVQMFPPVNQPVPLDDLTNITRHVPPPSTHPLRLDVRLFLPLNFKVCGDFLHPRKPFQPSPP